MQVGNSGLTKLAGLAGLLLAMGAARAEAPAFRPVAPGISYAKFRFETFSGHLFRVDLERASVRAPFPHGGVARQPVPKIVDDAAQVVAVNASFFDELDRAIGLVVDGGELLASRRAPKWSALVVRARRAQIVAGAEVKVDDKTSVVVQGFPRLVAAGKVEHLKPQIARRTAVCAAGRELLVVVTTDAEFNAFARFLVTATESGGAGCRDALNLDGGPSTQLEVRLPGFRLSEPGQPVPDALAVIPGAP